MRHWRGANEWWFPTLIDILHNRIRRRYHRFGFQSQFLKLEDCTLHYYERTGIQPSKTLVLLHGLGTSSSTWAYVLPKLDPSWTVLALDLPGFGFSKLNKDHRFFHFNELHASVVAFIEQKVARPFVLLGHSLGGWLAAKYAVQHADALRRLILVDNAGILHEETVQQGKAFELQTLRDLDRLLGILWARYPWYLKPFYPAVLHDLRKRFVSEFVRSIRPEDFINEDLSALTMNVNIVWGKQDRLITLKSVEIMRRAIPGAQISLIEKCGHVPQLERPREFVNIIRNLLREESEQQSPVRS